MTDILFGFRGELTRRQYFWCRLGIGSFEAVLLVLLFHVIALTDNGRDITFAALVLLPLALFFAPFIWMDLSIQSARIRDIGVRPHSIIFVLLLIYTVVVAAWIAIPEGSIPKALYMLSRGVGMIYSALLLWAPSGYLSHWTPDHADAVHPNAPRASIAHIAPTKKMADGNRTSFGQRGLNRR